jgi:tRNA(Glu) U13 pseudouridine synthase TruD
MYNRQRADSLADWNMQNDYNSPEAQMRRYKEAGLNPNLIYGQQSQTQAVRSTDAKSWNPQLPQIDVSSIGDAVNTYFNVQRQNSELETQKAQRSLIKAQEEYTRNKAISELIMPDYLRSKTTGEITKTAKTAFETDYLKQTADTNKLYLGYRNSAIQAQTALAKASAAYTTGKNTRENQLQPGKLETQEIDMIGKRLMNTLNASKYDTEVEKRRKITQEIENLKSNLEKLNTDNSMSPMDRAVKILGLFKK